MIEPLAETMAWQAAATAAEREAAAVDWVRRGQAAIGAEHLAVLDRQANLIRATCCGRSASVLVGSLPKDLDVVLHHSHPDEASLLGADFIAAWKQSPAPEARAYTPHGGTFRGRSLTQPQTWARRRQRALEAAGSELRILGRRRRASLTDATAHLVNVELAQIGHIWYGFVLSHVAEKVVDLIADDLPAVQAAIGGILAEEV